jgi:hypothetical protein
VSRAHKNSLIRCFVDSSYRNETGFRRMLLFLWNGRRGEEETIAQIKRKRPYLPTLSHTHYIRTLDLPALDALLV